MGLSGLARAFFESPVLVGLSIPAIIWAFLTVMWFGFGDTSPIVTTFLTAVPFVIINVAQGVQGVSRDLRDMSSSYGVPLGRRIKDLILPAVAGYVLAGVRFAVIIGWNGVLLAEWFGGSGGAGFRARYWYDANQFAGFAAWVILFVDRDRRARPAPLRAGRAAGVPLARHRPLTPVPSRGGAASARRPHPPSPARSSQGRTPRGNDMAVLTVKDLCKTFGAGTPRANRVLDNISFDVRGQTFVSIVGPSGCGKSTLLNIISGVETHTSGQISVTSDAGKPARLGYVFQDPRLLPWRSVRKNMLYVQDEADEAANRRVDKYLDMVGLGKHGDFWPGQLSGGMQQRVGIARAFAVEPDLLIMDEPFSHLDAITARALREQLQDIWSQSKKTVVFVTHDVVEAVELSDRIIVLQPGGRIFEDITIDLPRPRRQTDPAVATLQAEVLARLERMKGMAPQVSTAPDAWRRPPDGTTGHCSPVWPR